MTSSGGVERAVQTGQAQVPSRDESADFSPVLDFSLVLGSPLYQLYLRTRMARDPLDLAVRRTVIIPPLAWLPLPVLSLLQGMRGCPALSCRSSTISRCMPAT